MGRATTYEESLRKRRGDPAPEPLDVRVEKRAAELRAGNPTLTKAEAIAKVYESSPQLYIEECRTTDCFPPGYGGGPTDEEYATAFTKVNDYRLESDAIKAHIDELIEAELHRLSEERAASKGTKAAPAATREEALVRVLATTEGRRLRDRWLEAIAAERAASDATAA